MSVIPVLHPDASARDLVRRGVRYRGVRVLSCRNWPRLHQMASRWFVDGVVADLRSSRPDEIAEWAVRYPGIPVIAFSPFRPDDAGRIQAALHAGVQGLMVGGVDDAVLGDFVAANRVTARVRTELRDAPSLLRLTEQLQQRVWDEVLERADEPLRTDGLARALGMSREHLSREFAAGGAPNLKRVMDLARLAMAAALLANPGYGVGDVVQVLGFSTSSHLSGCASRIAGVRPGQLGELGPRGVLNRFRRGRTRSRL